MQASTSLKCERGTMRTSLTPIASRPCMLKARPTPPMLGIAQPWAPSARFTHYGIKPTKQNSPAKHVPNASASAAQPEEDPEETKASRLNEIRFFFNVMAVVLILVAVGTYSGAFAMLGEWFTNQTSWILHQFQLANVFIKVIMVLALALPLCIFFGFLYKTVTPEEESLGTAYKKTWINLLNLPGDMLDEPPASFLLLNFVFLIQTCLFAVVLGLVTDEIGAAFDSLRSGKLPVKEAEHVLVLNWNDQTLPFLRQAADANAKGDPFWQKGVVVLADRSKESMDNEIKSTITDYPNFFWTTRQGKPYNIDDLDHVSARRAKAVIVMEPSASNASQVAVEASKAATVMALTTRTHDLNDQQVLIQVNNATKVDENFMQAFKQNASTHALGGKYNAQELIGDQCMDKIVCQGVVQPGMLRVWQKFIMISEQDFRLFPVPESMVGNTFQYARRSFGSIVCGYMRNGTVCLNPSDTSILRSSDELVGISKKFLPKPSEKHRSVYEQGAERAKENVVGIRNYREQPRQILVIGWDVNDMDDMCVAFGEQAPKGSQVTVLSSEPVPKDMQIRRKGNCSFKYVVNENPLSLEVLENVGIGKVSGVVIGKNLLQSSEIGSDVITQAAFLRLQEAIDYSGRTDAPHIVSLVDKQTTADVVKDYLHLLSKSTNSTTVIKDPDFFEPSSIDGAMLAQVLAEPKAGALLASLLLTAEGCELYLRDPRVLNLPPGKTVNFAEVGETVRMTNQVAVGWLYADGTVRLVPTLKEERTICEGDKLIVIAEDYNFRKS